MTDQDKILWTFIGSIMGTGFGWTLNQTGQWFRTRAEDRRLLKQVLFHQLDLYHYCIKLDIEKILLMAVNSVFTKLPPEAQTPEIHKEIEKKALADIETNILSLLHQMIEVVESEYKKSVQELAKADPHAAFYLSGKTNLITKFEGLMKSYMAQIALETPEAVEASKKSLQILRKNILGPFLVDFRSDIIKTAFKIGLVCGFKTMKVTRKIAQKASTLSPGEIDGLLSGVESLGN